jgi:hypothetical protein
MADTLEQIAERLTTELFTNGQGQHADRLVLTQRLGSGAEADLGGWCELAVRDRIISALQSLARERDDLRANEDAIRSAYGWKRDGRELPELIAELAASLSVQEPRGQETCAKPGCKEPGVQWGKCWTHAEEGTEVE